MTLWISKLKFLLSLLFGCVKVSNYTELWICTISELREFNPSTLTQSTHNQRLEEYSSTDILSWRLEAFILWYWTSLCLCLTCRRTTSLTDSSTAENFSLSAASQQWNQVLLYHWWPWRKEGTVWVRKKGGKGEVHQGLRRQQLPLLYSLMCSLQGN